MTPNEDARDITAQAFMDDALLPAERIEFLERMQPDASIRRRFCDFLYQKELVRHAYATVPAAPSRPKVRHRGHGVRRAALDAALAGLVGPGLEPYVQAEQIGVGLRPPACGLAPKTDTHRTGSSAQTRLDGKRGLIRANRMNSRSDAWPCRFLRIFPRANARV